MTPRKNQYHKLRKRILWRMRVAINAVELPLRVVLSKIYAPKDILSKDSSNAVKLSQVQIGDSSYTVAQIEAGRIFTDRMLNISVISDHSLVPFVSWQYRSGRSRPDTENALLNKKPLINRPPTYIQGTVISLVSGGGGNYNYYHWLFDCLPRLYIAQTFIKPDAHTKYFIPENTHAFQKQTLHTLGIPESECISSKKLQHLKATNLIATAAPNPNPPIIPKWIYDFLRASFLKTPPLNTKSSYVYISRGDSVNDRRLLNEPTLIKALQSLGFEVYKLSELSFPEQIALFFHAKMIVGVHGAGFANLTFASPGTIVYELFSEQYQPGMYESLSMHGALEYHKVVCTDEETGDNAQKADFSIAEDQIAAIVEHAKRVTLISNYAKKSIYPAS